MALKNSKWYQGEISRNAGIFDIDQVQLETRAAVPTDTNLANGRLVYITGTGLRAYIGSTWVTIGASGGGAITSWDELYDTDKTLSVDDTTFTLSGATGLGAGAVLTIENAGTGYDIKAPYWSIISTGNKGIVEITSGGTINAAGGALTIGKTGTATTFAGTITANEAVTITGAATATASITITGTATTTVFTITAGDEVITDGSISITDADEATTVTIVNNTAAAVNVVSVTADAIAAGGSLLYLDSLAAGMSTGLFIRCYDNAATAFSVGLYGATIIAGAAANNVFTVTAGDLVVTDGSLTLADADDAAGGALSITSTAVFAQTTSGVVTIIADAATTGNIIDVNADGLTNGTMLHLDSTTAGWGTGKYIDCFDGAASEFSVGLDGATIITPSAAGTIALTIASASTTGDAMDITCTALTTGDALQITSTAETLAAGELLKIVNTEDGDLSATPKTGNLASITSSVTATTTSTALDYDALLISRSNINFTAVTTLTAAGSVLKLINTSTNTGGTCTDSTVGLEVVMADGGTAAPTGTAVDVISVGVGAKALNIASASTTVSDVLITGSGVKADNKASLEVVNSGATAAGGSILRVTNAGIPAAATSYLVDFDYGGATMTNNPVAVYINNKDSTAAALQITGSGVMAGGSVEIINTNAGALGAVLKIDAQSATPAASDVIGRIDFYGKDSGAAAQQYAKIDAMITDPTAASEDADLLFYVAKAGTVTQLLQLDSDIAGILVGSAAATAIVTSKGAYDLTLNTNSGTDSGTITITDAANGDIVITPNGIGQTQLFAPAWQVTNKTAAATLTVAEGGVITVATAGGAFSLTLPAAATSAGLWYTVIKTDADAIACTLDGNGAETINGAATYAAIDAQYDSATIACNGAAWYLVCTRLT